MTTIIIDLNVYVKRKSYSFKSYCLWTVVRVICSKEFTPYTFTDLKPYLDLSPAECLHSMVNVTYAHHFTRTAIYDIIIILPQHFQ